MSQSEPTRKKSTKLKMNEILAVSKLVEADKTAWASGTANIQERVAFYQAQTNIKLCRRQVLNIVKASGIDLSWVTSSPSGSLRASTRQRYQYLLRDIVELQTTVANLTSRVSILEAVVHSSRK